MRKSLIVLLGFVVACSSGDDQSVDTPDTKAPPTGIAPPVQPSPNPPSGPVAPQPTPPTGTFTVNATVELLGIEGGCWVLKAGSTTYLPLDLPAAFKQDGLNVTATLSSQNGVATICMTGDPVRVVSIARR